MFRKSHSSQRFSVQAPKSLGIEGAEFELTKLPNGFSVIEDKSTEQVMSQIWDMGRHYARHEL